MVEEHVEQKTIKDVVITPAHGQRDHREFDKSVNQLKKDGNYHCAVTGETENIQVHHIAEFSLANAVDYDKLKSFLMIFDPFGYSKKLIDKPITSIDDIRNLLPLAARLHNNVNETAGNGIGIHNCSFPTWVSEVVCPKENPVPQDGETVEDVMKRVD